MMSTFRLSGYHKHPSITVKSNQASSARSHYFTFAAGRPTWRTGGHTLRSLDGSYAVTRNRGHFQRPFTCKPVSKPFKIFGLCQSQVLVGAAACARANGLLEPTAHTICERIFFERCLRRRRERRSLLRLQEGQKLAPA